MGNSIEHEFINKCRQLIEHRLGRAQIEAKLNNSDFGYLTEEIFNKTKVSISVSTLKRIWQVNSRYKPHVSTLDALARFIDYDNWHDFKSKVKSEIKPVPVQAIPLKRSKRIIMFFFILTIVCIAFCASKDQRIKSDDRVVFDPDDIIFTSKKAVTSGLPNSVVFYYDITKAEFDSAFIQQSWDPRRRQRISKNEHYHSSIYYYPDCYNARLILNDSVVKKFPLCINTDGWVAIYSREFLQDIPFYFTNVVPIKDNRLFISTDDLEKNKITNDNSFFISFYNVKDFGEVYCDNFSLESEIKNDPGDGGLTCQLAGISVTGDTGIMMATFGQKGCISRLELSFSDYILDGTKSDMSAFGTDLTKWRNIKYEVIDKNVKIYIDSREVFKFSYTRDIGRVVGIAYHFYGCGSVRKSNLYDKTGKLVFEEKFK